MRNISISRACALADLNRSLYYYHLQKPKNDSDAAFVLEIKKIRSVHHAIGAKKLAKLISANGVKVNHKRIARILKENNLTASRKKRPRVRINNLERLPIPKDVSKRNALWSIDFMCARKNNKFRFMLLNAIDIGTRYSPLMRLERSFTSYDVTDELAQAFDKYGKPAGIITDNGAEFTSSHFRGWCRRNGIVHHLTNVGTPAENCFIESFNSSVRREMLEANDFDTMNDLRKKIGIWRDYYNKKRPHGSLGYQSPENYINLSKTSELVV